MCSTWATESCRRRIRTSCERSWGSSTSRLGGDEEAVMSRIFEDERTAVLLTAGGGAHPPHEGGSVPLVVGGGGASNDGLVYEILGGKRPNCGEETPPLNVLCPARTPP